MIPTGKKIITYKFKEDDGAMLSINNDKVYYLYETVNYMRGGRTLIASGIRQIVVNVKRRSEVPDTNYKFDYYSLIGYLEINDIKKPFCIFDVEEVKINPYLGIIYIYIK